MRIKNALLGGLIFSLIYAIIQLYMYSWQKAFLSALISGLFFTVFIYFFTASKKKLPDNFPFDADEDLIYSAPANHFKSIEAVGGHLYLTNKRLFFQSHKVNFQNHIYSINLADIISLENYNTLGLIPNGLKLNVLNHSSEKFVVSGRNIWKVKIKKLQNTLA